MKQPILSVVVPVYNEETRVGNTLAASAAYLRRRKIPCEILVVDDGSNDKTLEVVESHRGSFPRHCTVQILRHSLNRGKGAAVRTGALASRGQFMLYMDADNSTPLSVFEKFEEAFEKGVDVVVGSRAVDRSQIKVHQPFLRESMGRVFNLMVQALALPGLWDTQCGFKAFTRRAVLSIFPLQTIERFGFDVELLYVARKKGFWIKEVQVPWADSPGSRVRVLRDATRMFFDLLTIRMNDLRGRYRDPKDERHSSRDGRGSS